LLGHREQALVSSQSAIDLSERLSHPPSQAHALVFAARLHAMRQDFARARISAQAGLEIASELDLPLYRASSNIVLGWARIKAGKVDPGFDVLTRGLAERRTIAAGSAGPLYWSLLADACAHCGQIDDAFGHLQEALEIASTTGERHWEAELHRQMADLMRHRGDDDDSLETCYRRAIDVAQGQSAKSLELRAAARLADLWHERGRDAEARALLQPICAWFIEGRDSPDIREALALLDSLG
jgi:predicted ATPase